MDSNHKLILSVYVLLGITYKIFHLGISWPTQPSHLLKARYPRQYNEGLVILSVL